MTTGISSPTGSIDRIFRGLYNTPVPCFVPRNVNNTFAKQQQFMIVMAVGCFFVILLSFVVSSCTAKDSVTQVGSDAIETPTRKNERYFKSDERWMNRILESATTELGGGDADALLKRFKKAQVGLLNSQFSGVPMGSDPNRYINATVNCVDLTPLFSWRQTLHHPPLAPRSITGIRPS